MFWFRSSGAVIFCCLVCFVTQTLLTIVEYVQVKNMGWKEYLSKIRNYGDMF